MDNTGTVGPENIFLSGPEAGVYTVMIEHWGKRQPRSRRRRDLNVAGKTYTATIANLAPQHVVTIGIIEWPSGEVVLSGSVYDCTTEWSGGCDAALPGSRTTR